MNEHDERRLAFFAASDALKHITRANTTTDGARQENVAEHSWHVTLLAMVLAHAAPEDTDHNRVRDLLTVHDLVEIHAGDVVIWDEVPEALIREREVAAAQSLFGLLPEPQAARFHALWAEFDAQVTTEARFARAIDALQPMLMSWGPGSVGHPRTDLRPARVLARKRPMIEPFPMLWAIAQAAVASGVERGLIEPDEEGNAA
jgi:putative hydrolase of HD superfamily